MKLNEIYRSAPDKTYVTHAEVGDGPEIELTVHYDISKGSPATMTDPEYPTEIEINSILTPEGRDILDRMSQRWLDNLVEEIEEHEIAMEEDPRY